MKKISNFAELITKGTTPSTLGGKFDNGPVNFIKVESISGDGMIVADSLEKISLDTHDKLRRSQLREGDLLITIAGALGRAYVVERSLLPANTNQAVGIVRLDQKKASPHFIKYSLNSPWLKRSIDTINAQSIQKNLNLVNLGDLEIPSFDIEMQRKIAGVLSSLDEKIQFNHKITAEIEQMARTLYDYWFVQFDFPDANGKPYKSSGGQMAYNDQLKREIPAGWEELKLQDVLEFEKGTEPGAGAYSEVKNDEHDLSFYRVGDIDGETSTYIDSSKFNAKVVKPTDVIVTFDGSVGKMGLGLDGAISGGLRHIYDKTGKISDAGVYAIFRDEYVIKTIERYATGSVILHASSSIPYLAIPYDEKVFAKFQKIIEPMFEKIIANRQQSQKLAELRDWLLPMLMNGQVSVE